MSKSRPHYSAEFKQEVLSHYNEGQRGSGFAALAARFYVAGGSRTIRRWFNQWDGTISSLQQQSTVGRPPLLQPAEIQQHIGTTVQSYNRHHQSVHYPELLAPVRASTGTSLSLRTLERYGKETLHIKTKATKKWTERECKITDIFISHIISSYIRSLPICV
jgi:transposase-like protein